MPTARTQPELLARITEVAGQSAADLVAAEWGGRVLYFPATLKSGHRLAELVGFDKAKAICNAIGSGNVMVPMAETAGPAQRRRRVAELLDKHVSHSEAARGVGVHTRTVERVAAKLAKNSNQDDLF